LIESYSPSRFGDDHLGSQFIELVPEVLVLKITLNTREFLTVALGFEEFGVRIRSWSRGGGFFGSIVIGISIRGCFGVSSRSRFALFEISGGLGSEF
jgi:hypothetical protein